ncbi:hypothetical protein J2X83_002294 [Brevibacillus nitrificans]|nr:hypothetical protein [Brevibacillus nitrificans]
MICLVRLLIFHFLIQRRNRTYFMSQVALTNSITRRAIISESFTRYGFLFFSYMFNFSVLPYSSKVFGQ